MSTESKNGYGGKEQTLAATVARVSSIVGSAADDLERTTSGEKVPLNDDQRVQEVTLKYLRECSTLGVLPTVRGVAARLGVSRQALYDHNKRHPGSTFAKWLEDFSDLCGELTAQAAIEGVAAAVPSIFVLKSRYSWREAPAQLEIGRLNPLNEDGRNIDDIAAEIASRYNALPED